MAIDIQETDHIEWTQRTSVNGGSWYGITHHSHPYLKKVRGGVDTPNFHKRRANGELIPHTEWVSQDITHDWQPANITTLRLSDGWNAVTEGQSFEWYEFLLGPAHSADTAFAMSELQRAAASISGAGYDALTGLLEARKVKDMLLSTARSLRKAMANSKRLRRRDILDAWLEGRYGYRTLAYDVRDLDDAIRNFDEKRTIWTERSGYSVNDSSTTESSDNSWNSRSWVITQTDYTEHSIRGAVAAKVKPARFGVNPVATAWELTPYSFVLDWVLSVGDALGTAHLLAVAEATTGSIGVKSVSTRTAKSVSTAKANHEVTGDFSYTGTCTRITRTPSNISIVPQIRGRMLSPAQHLDLTTLVGTEKRRIR